MLIEHNNPDVPLTRQCSLLTLSRSSLYYRPHRDEADAAFELRLLNAIDELYTARPNLGRGGMTDALAQERQIVVNPKRVRRLMKVLGLAA
ncbi:MAG: IS3 family transposase, partial [Phycisphaerae bacterium]|nr:IS3 family transposase [Phycisphaerae bacterium]